MQYPVVIQQKDKHLFRALIPFLPDCAGEGPTEEVAMSNLRQVAQQTLAHVKLTTLEIDEHMSREWPHFGIFKDDPTWGEIFDEIERQRDATLEDD
jgi:predicted RNase H-like HicB family nuclease